MCAFSCSVLVSPQELYVCSFLVANIVIRFQTTLWFSREPYFSVHAATKTYHIQRHTCAAARAVVGILQKTYYCYNRQLMLSLTFNRLYITFVNTRIIRA